MTDPVFLLAALLAGLAGAGHCAGMCGGIAGALAHAIPARERTVLLTLGYSIGRLGSYALLGAAAGFAAALLSPRDAGLAMLVARVLTGILLLAIALYLLDLTRWMQSLEVAGAAIWRRLAPLARRLLPVTTLPRAVALGALWGLLPCGLVYGALLYAATAGSAAAGALSMLAFGIGTLPAVLGLGAAARWLSQHARAVRRGSGTLLLVVALWTLLSTLLALPAILDGTCRTPGDVMRIAVDLLFPG
ncbi:MAG: sulfite exporter TauE/SafE family protein [Pseudomonadota bacterium]